MLRRMSVPGPSTGAWVSWTSRPSLAGMLWAWSETSRAKPEATGRVRRMADGESPNGPRRVKSVVNAIRVLETLKSAPEPLRLSEISRQLGLRKSTVHLLLATLAEHNFVQHDGPL